MSASTGSAVLGFSFLVLLILLGVVLFIRVRKGLDDRRARQEARDRAEAWRAEQMNRPALAGEEAEQFKGWYLNQQRPAALLSLGQEIEPGPHGCHVGGRVWIPQGEAWPTTSDGAPLQFLAQLDFADLPPLADFPRSGVVQFFTGADDLYGANFDDLFVGAFRVIWRPAPDAAGALMESPQAEEDYSPLSRKLRQASRRLVPKPATMLPSAYSADVGAYAPAVLDRPGSDAIVNWMDGHENANREVHHVGGYPGTTQDDFRRETRYASLDRVLLQLWSETDGSIMWGDMGQGSFTISQADLRAQRFDRVAFHWDCC
jgi:uncharacterized protein YwqG